MGQPPMDAPGMPAGTGGPRVVPWRALRRVLIILSLAGFTLLSLIGIALILGETAPGQATTRFLALFGLAGVFGLTAVAATIPFARSMAAGLGWVGLVASGLAFLLTSILVLGDVSDESLAQLATVTGNLAGTAALASLLLMVRGRDVIVDGLITVTWILLGLSFVLAMIQVFGGGTGEGLAKLVISVAILTTLGLIATPLVALWMGPGRASPVASAEPPGPPPVA